MCARVQMHRKMQKKEEKVTATDGTLLKKQLLTFHVFRPFFPYTRAVRNKLKKKPTEAQRPTNKQQQAFKLSVRIV